MNKTLIILVAAVVLVGGGYWFYTSSGAAAPGTMKEGSMMQKLSGTFASIRSSGQNVVCDYEFSNGVSQSSGRMYIAAGGERMRGDFTITAPAAMESHMIRAGGYNYMWSSSMPQGIKMAVTEENKDKLFDSKDANIPDDVGYNCSPWSVDASMFTPPSNVSFMDMGAQMEQMKKMMPAGSVVPATGAPAGAADVKAMQCAACDQVPGEGREQCRMALGCN